MFDKLPEDPLMMMSFVNTKLRDYYSSLDQMCEDMQLDKDGLLGRMADFGFEYNPEANKFW